MKCYQVVRLTSSQTSPYVYFMLLNFSLLANMYSLFSNSQVGSLVGIRGVCVIRA